MKLKNISIGLILIILLASLAYAVEFTPQGNINLKNRYNITNADWIFGSISAENVKDPPTNPGTGYAISYFVSNFSTIVASFFNIDGDKFIGDFNADGNSIYGLDNTTSDGVYTDTLGS